MRAVFDAVHPVLDLRAVTDQPDVIPTADRPGGVHGLTDRNFDPPPSLMQPWLPTAVLRNVGFSALVSAPPARDSPPGCLAGESLPRQDRVIERPSNSLLPGG